MKDLKKKNILKFEQLRWCWQTSEFNILLLAWQTSVKMIGVSGSGRTEGNSTKSSFHYHRQRRYVGISCLYINQPPTVCRSIRRMSEELSTRRARPLTPPCSADRNHGWRHCREQSFTPPTTDHTQTPPSHLQIHKRDRAATDRLLSRRSRSVSLMYYFIIYVSLFVCLSLFLMIADINCTQFHADALLPHWKVRPHFPAQNCKIGTKAMP